MHRKIPSVAILTRHDVPNYGSFLQTLATQRIMEELSLSPTIIDYKRDDDTSSALIKQYCEDHKGILYKIYYNTLWRYSHSHIEHLMKRERERYLHCSTPVNKETIGEVYGHYDLYLTGSDQVWNTVGSGRTKEIDSVYFWENAPSYANVFSYASSFGDNKLRNDEFQKCKKGLEKFKHISVREESGIDILKKMGYTAKQLIDPTMLVESDYWRRIAETSSLRSKRKYALIYNLHSNSNMNDYILNDLKDSQLDIYSITTTFRKGIGKNVFCPSIQDFLFYFMNASCIYADSFHAIAFSIIFNTPIVVMLPKQYSTRLESILKLFDLEDCLADKKEKVSWDEKRINWSLVNKKLEKERYIAREWLENCISEMIGG